jgi:ATP/maltotriose-dependent transcriptional regulator MalT/DNA-binding SARP family transcriptional activator
VKRRSSGVPAPAPHELRRERLLEALHKHRNQPLILLVAAAGFGKSTLAATYARDSGAAVAWLTLRQADRDSRRLFAHLADALEDCFDEPDAVRQLRRGLEDGSEGVGLARLLLADLAEAPAGFMLILDDFHLVDDADEVVSAIDTLVRDLPEAGQIILTAREAPPLSMTRLVADGAVFPVGTEELRFTPDESRALREAVWGSDARRDEQAEGWVAGILLGGASRELGAALLDSYVQREVLHRLSPTEQCWLEMLSVFDSITVVAAERVLGPGPWRSRLLALAERCPFLVTGQDGSFRLHALVREAILKRLRRSEDDRATVAWSAAREIAAESLDTAALVRACDELGQIDGAVELVRRVATEGVQRGRWRAVLVTLELLPDRVRRAYPDLSLIEARALLNTGRPQQAREAAETALHLGGRTDDVQVQVSATIELAMVTFANDMAASQDWLAAADHLMRNNQGATEQWRLLEGRALGIRGICATLRGDVAEARRAFESGERILRLLGPSRDLALLQQNFGSFCNRTGDYATAEETLGSAASHWRLMGDSNGRANTLIVLGDLHLRLGNLEAAGAELSDALAAARSVGGLRMEAHATASLGQWHRANGRIADAVAAFDSGLQLADEIVERELLADTLVWRAEAALLQADMTLARALLARAQAEGQRGGSTASQASVDRALGRLHLVDGDTDRAVQHLNAAMHRAANGWGPDQRAETLYWLGTAYLSQGHAQQASACLEQAVAVAEEANLPALLAGPAAEDPHLLQRGRQVGLHPVFLAEVDRLSATRRPWTGVAPTDPQDTPDSDLPRVEVQLFGSFVLHCNGHLYKNGSRKLDRARELMALLILHPGGLPDESIAERMWPGMAPESALHNLQMAAYSLRKDLGSKTAVLYGSRTYQLNPQLELLADVRMFDAALARARGATEDILRLALSRAIDLYRDPLLADAAWHWLEPVRFEYRSRYVSAALQLADLLAPTDLVRSDGLADAVLAIAPETDLAYERLIHNARQRHDPIALRRASKRYVQAAALFDFPLISQLIADGQTESPRIRTSRR